MTTAKDPLYRFVIDQITSKGCRGWYNRYDGQEEKIFIFINDILVMETLPSISRPDVASLGLGKSLCGFSIDFPKLSLGKNTIVFKDVEKNILYSSDIYIEKEPQAAFQEKLLVEVEPFVEVNLKKMRHNLLESTLFTQYKTYLTGRLQEMDHKKFAEELIDILAEMKTTLHLVGAAYIESERYKDPEFIKKIPQQKKTFPDDVIIDFRGDITGSNWHEAENDGRWAGPMLRSSLLIPALSTGIYEITLQCVGEVAPGIIDSMQLLVNEFPVSLTRTTTEIPTDLKGTFHVDENYKFPFWYIHFIFQKVYSPAELESALTDKRKLTIRLSSLHLEKVA